MLATYGVYFVLQVIISFAANKFSIMFRLLIWIPPYGNLSIFSPHAENSLLFADYITVLYYTDIISVLEIDVEIESSLVTF